MAADIPTTEPAELVAGDTWRWDRSFADYSPTDGWELSYAVRGPSDLDAVFGDEVTAVGGGFEIRVPAAKTTLTPGNYQLVGFMVNGAERDTVVVCPLLVQPDPASAVNALSTDERLLAAIEAVIAGRATVDHEETQVNGRRVKNIPFLELLEIRGLLRQAVLAERDLEERTVEVEFGAP